MLNLHPYSSFEDYNYEHRNIIKKIHPDKSEGNKDLYLEHMQIKEDFFQNEKQFNLNIKRLRYIGELSTNKVTKYKAIF